MDYRQRCYQAYNLHWKNFHSCSKEEFDFCAKVAKKKFKAFLPTNKAAKIIDIACGTGHFIYFLKKENYTNVRGIDLSAVQLDTARKMGITEVEEADLFEYLPRFSNEFDMIIANHIIEHLKKEEVFKFLDTIFTALHPGGTFLLATPNTDVASIYMDFTHEVGFNLLSLEQVLRICGFKNIEIYGDAPVAYDPRSFFRTLAWKVIKTGLRAYHIVKVGTGRGMFTNRIIFESQIFAVAKK